MLQLSLPHVLTKNVILAQTVW